MNQLRLVDENLRTAMGFFAGATGKGHIQTFDSSFAIHSGLDYGVFNIALLTEPLKPGPRGLEGQLADCARFYESRSSRWSFWLCEDYLDAKTRRQSKQIFHNSNLREISRAPAMITSGLSPVDRKLPELQCISVADPTSRAAFGELTSICFDIPLPITKSVYLPDRAWQGAYKGYVGWSEGQPVSMIATVVCNGVVGIYSLGTLPQYRNRGYGEALLRAAVRLCPPGLPLVLESTAAGYPLYRRLGFREVGKFAVYLTK